MKIKEILDTLYNEHGNIGVYVYGTKLLNEKKSYPLSELLDLVNKYTDTVGALDGNYFTIEQNNHAIYAIYRCYFFFQSHTNYKNEMELFHLILLYYIFTNYIITLFYRRR